MELFEQDSYRCETVNLPDISVMVSLFALYHPLIGSDAAALYSTLLVEAQKQNAAEKHYRLCKIMNKEIADLERARIRLEQFGLLRTYFSKQEDTYIYQLIRPLSADDFLKHYVYGIQFKKALGISDYELSKEKYGSENLPRSGYTEITAKFNQTEFQKISAQDMEEFINVKVNDIKDDRNMGYPKEFDYQAFIKDLSELTFPRKLRTPENIRLIAQLATIYGISISRMRVLACRSISIKDQTFDANGLINRVRREQPVYENTSAVGYDLPPLLFLQNKQPGIPVSLSSKKTLEYLVNDTPLSTPVVNFLIEYVLDNSNNILNQKYVEKVAETFVRSQIGSLEEAKELIKRLKRTTKEQEMRQNKIMNSDVTAQPEKAADPEDLVKLRRQFNKEVEKLK